MLLWKILVTFMLPKNNGLKTSQVLWKHCISVLKFFHFLFFHSTFIQLNFLWILNIVLPLKFYGEYHDQLPFTYKFYKVQYTLIIYYYCYQWHNKDYSKLLWFSHTISNHTRGLSPVQWIHVPPVNHYQQP